MSGGRGREGMDMWARGGEGGGQLACRILEGSKRGVDLG